MAEQTKDQYVKEQLVVQGLKNTAANRKKLGNEYDTKFVGGKSSDWRNRFRVEFPEFSDLVDGAEGEAQARKEFGDDLIDLFLDYAKNPDNYDFTTQAGRDVWASKVKATKLYTQVGPARREWTLTPESSKQEQIKAKRVELLQTFGTLELNENQLTDLATYALSNKANPAQTKYYAYSIVAARKTQPDGAMGLEQTDEAQTLRDAMKRFNYNPPGLEEQINSALTGTPYLGTTYTSDLLIKKARDNAKIMMPHFAQQFDQGYTLEDVFEPYREIAARTLEMNPTDINLFDPRFSKALERKQDGNSLSGTDWEYILKSDPTYNWSNTRQAKQKTASIINTLERAFGQYIG